MVSFGSVLSGIIAVVLLSIYGYFFITHIRRPIYQDMRFLIFLLLIAGIRMLFPFNLPLNITIPDKIIFVPISDIVFTEVPESNLLVYQLIIRIWLTVGIVLLLTKAIKYYRFVTEVKKFTYNDKHLDSLLSDRVLNHHPKKTSASYADAKVSPFVFGLLHPTIVIPDKEYSEDELKYVLDHELTHINQHDLFLKSLFNVLTAIFWWNPFIWMIRKQADNAIELSNDISLYKKLDDTEKANYAALLVKTAAFSTRYESQHSLSLSTHSDPILKQRVYDIINGPTSKQTLLALHIILMILIVSVSLIVTIEPYSIHNNQIGDSYDLEDQFGETAEDSYIVDRGDHYDLYIDGKFVFDFYEIPDDFKDYPVYTDNPGDGK